MSNAPKTVHLRWLPWLLLLGMPLMLDTEATDPYSALRWTCLAVVSLLAWGLRRRQIREIWSQTPIWWTASMGLFALGGCISLFTALHPLLALLQVARWQMLLSLAPLLAWEMRRDALLLAQLPRAASSASLLISSVFLLHRAKVFEPDWLVDGSALMANPNFLAGTMAVLSILGIYGAISSNGLWRWWGIAGTLVAILVLALGTTTGALVAFAIAGWYLVLGLVAWRHPNAVVNGSRWLKAALWILPAIAMVGLVGWLMRRPATNRQVLDDSSLERGVLWRNTVDMISEYPLTGVGAGHWRFHIVRLGVVSSYQGYATRYHTHAHNDLLQATAERGILGGLAWAALWIGCMVALWRQRPGVDTAAAAAGLSAWLAFSFTNLPSDQAYLCNLLVWLGALSLMGSIPKSHDRMNRWGPALTLLTIVSSALLLLVHGLQIGMDRRNMDLLLAKERQDWPTVARLGKELVRWYNPDDRVANTPIIWYQGVALLTMGDARGSLPSLEAAKAYHPWHPQVSSNLGVAYFMAGQREKGVAELEDLITRFPEFGDARINLGEMYLTIGDMEGAKRTVAPWAQPTGNPHYDDYYKKVMSMASPAPQ